MLLCPAVVAKGNVPVVMGVVVTMTTVFHRTFTDGLSLDFSFATIRKKTRIFTIGLFSPKK